MRLEGWESLAMVLRYTKSVKFEESLRVYMTLYLKQCVRMSVGDWVWQAEG